MALGLCALLSACGSTSAPLEQQAYVWQRQWTPELAQSLAGLREVMSGWRVLAAETGPNGTIDAIDPTLDLLARDGSPVVAVLRIDGSRPPPTAAQLEQRIDAIASDWPRAGVVLSGFEIDHDCATAQLAAYADLLAQVRQHVPGTLTLSITALPAWIGSSELAHVRNVVDSSVLQVHAVVAPRAGAAGLFDVAQARRWIDAYAAASSRPFRVALPAYAVRVAFDDAGHAVAVAGEAPRALPDGDTRELRADPAAVAALLQTLRHAHPATLLGVAWFRLPVESDRRAWSLTTLKAVISATALRAEVTARGAAQTDGSMDIVLANRGNLDAPLPASVSLEAPMCEAADALSGFRAEKTEGGWRFLLNADAILRAGHERRIGWARCTSVDRISLHADP